MVRYCAKPNFRILNQILVTYDLDVRSRTFGPALDVSAPGSQQVNEVITGDSEGGAHVFDRVIDGYTHVVSQRNRNIERVSHAIDRPGGHRKVKRVVAERLVKKPMGFRKYHVSFRSGKIPKHKMAHGKHVSDSVLAAGRVQFDVFLIVFDLGIPRRSTQKIVEVLLFSFARKQSSEIANKKARPRIPGAWIGGDPNYSRLSLKHWLGKLFRRFDMGRL
jgi:hypothetical protein